MHICANFEKKLKGSPFYFLKMSRSKTDETTYTFALW